MRRPLPELTSDLSRREEMPINVPVSSKLPSLKQRVKGLGGGGRVCVCGRQGFSGQRGAQGGSPPRAYQAEEHLVLREDFVVDVNGELRGDGWRQSAACAEDRGIKGAAAHGARLFERREAAGAAKLGPRGEVGRAEARSAVRSDVAAKGEGRGSMAGVDPVACGSGEGEGAERGESERREKAVQRGQRSIVR